MPGASNEPQVWGVVPAAGLSRRMGRTKQTLPYRDTTLVGSVVRTLLCAKTVGVVVVTRDGLAEAMDLPRDPRVRVTLNDDPTSEMIDSIRLGLGAIAKARSGIEDTARCAAPVGVIVIPGDVPTVTIESCRRCIAAFLADPDRIVIATHAAKRGHPIVFSLSLRSVVDQLEGGLRALPHALPDRVHLVETGDPGVIRDVDTRDDFNRL